MLTSFLAKNGNVFSISRLVEAIISWICSIVRLRTSCWFISNISSPTPNRLAKKLAGSESLNRDMNIPEVRHRCDVLINEVVSQLQEFFWSSDVIRKTYGDR